MSFITYGSLVVPQLSTRHAQWCLTSEFGWNLAFPPWYEQMTIYILKYKINLNLIKKKKNK